jgi:ABC-type transport system involved in multi-copper enzyme maturation permease subunit
MITALRDFLFIGLLAVILIAIFVSSFLGGTALTEQHQMTIAYVSGSTRLILAIGLIIFVCFHVKRLFDNKEVEFILAKPISRKSFVFSYWLAFAILSLVITTCVAIFVGIFTHPNFHGLVAWGASLMCEGLIIVAFALVSALILRSAVASVLSTLCFYFLSRMMGFFVVAIKVPFNTQLPDANYFMEWISQWVLELTSTLLPRLDLFAKTKWLIYGIENYNELLIFSLQSLVYIPLLLTMAIVDFNRKQF